MTPDRFPGDVSADADPGVGRLSGGATSGSPGGRKSAWLAFGLGVAVSVAANVAHTWYPAGPALRSYATLHRGSAAGWRPEIGAQMAAAFYPLSLLLTVELLTRVRWPAGVAWSAARFGGTGVVAVVAAVVSYRHMAALLAAYGEDRLTARIGPLAVDGLMVVASFALLALGRARPPAATAPAMAPAMAPATRPADPTAPPLVRQPEDHPAAMAAGKGRRQAAERPSDADARQRADVLLAERPEMTGRDLAAALGVSERTGQRIAREVRQQMAARRPDSRPLRVAGDENGSS